ncbi:MAG TPA: amidase [Steroidobacteraceae bacterium]|nr:amidase [Steroidobacteraceae bacterium]
MSQVTRRELLLAGALCAVPAANAGAGTGTQTAEATAGGAASCAELCGLSAFELSQRIRAKQVSCAEVMTAHLRQIERYNPNVNAIVSLQDGDALLTAARERDAQLARGEYLGWMHGFPHAVKDLAPTRGIRTSYGSPLLDGIPNYDAIFVERLRRNGAILIGKTNAPEMGFGSQSYNPVFGTTLNAYDQSRCAGGSSGGAAVALALRMVPVADGSDMMGSLRNPAAFNNVFGFRPSWGRVPSGDGELFLHTLSCDGPMGRSVRDVAMLLSVMAGPDARVPLAIEQPGEMFAGNLERTFRGTRLAWLGDLGGHLPMQAGVLELCQQSFAAFEALGCQIESAQPEFSPERLWSSWLTLRHALSASGLAEFYRDPAKRSRLKPEIQWEVAGGLKLSALQLAQASTDRSEWYRAVEKLFTRFDFLLLPSAQVFPFDARVHWPREIQGRNMDTYHRWMEVVIGPSLAGLPAMSVPVGFGPAGVPMGMQLIGAQHADLAVLQLAHAYEQAAPWTRTQLPALLRS